MPTPPPAALAAESLRPQHASQSIASCREFAMRRAQWYRKLLAGLLLAVSTGALAQRLPPSGPLDAALNGGLEWRNVGPFRGGRVTAVSGVLQDERSFYMGSTGGGVWKTSDGGIGWHNVSDGYFRAGTVGAIAVAPSNPDIVFVGMGEHCIRIETFASGDGMYRSTDGGKSWKHIGLETSQQISSIKVDPTDPKIVYVAVQGSPWGPQEGRGVYKSVDGGDTWNRVLAGGASTGASDLAMDPKNPSILYAAMWQHDQEPWHGYQIESGGPGSALYKSVDGGRRWSRIQNGIPASVGRVGIAVSGADSNRLYALVEAKPEVAGLYRSDDAGASWALVNKDHVMAERSGYYMHIVADPNQADTVFVLHAPLLKSTNGGKSFAPLRPPHGDNHAMWINPKNSDWLIDGNDGGAHVSYNGGKSWSSELNQPTAQIYRLTVDNLFPYNLYGGQQDNSTPKTKSRSFSDGIGIRDWYDVGRGESAYVALDPDNPVLIYAGNYQGQITEYDDRTGVLRNVQRYPLQTAYRPGELYHWRFNWNAPILLSIHDRKTLYHGSQFLLKSTDRGQHWVEISPDLTRNDPKKHGFVAGAFTTDGIAGSMYNTIHYIAESQTRAGELWVGTDDGRVHLTRDEGKHWTEITPPGIGETLINAIELSPHQEGKAWVVATRFRFNDRAPNILVTEDYGRSWRRIVQGIAAEDFARVVREDPVRKGLLYAGTEHGLHVSFDDGSHWQPLQLNLPRVPITDLRLHDGDLIASTQGRAFWVLDDVAPLRAIAETEPKVVTLFAPSPLRQIKTGRSREGGQGTNPPSGAMIYYWLPPGTRAEDIKLEILDAAGMVVNRYAAASPPAAAPRPSAAAGEAEKEVDEETPRPDAGTARPSARAGLNRFVWDWQASAIDPYPELKAWRASRAYRVSPGHYQARLIVGATSQTQPFEVRPDPRVTASDGQYLERQVLLGAIKADSVALLDAVQVMKAAHQSLQQRIADPILARDRKAIRAAIAFDRRIERWLDLTVEINNRHFVDPSHSAERLDFNLLAVLGMVDNMDPPLTAGMIERVGDVRGEWTRRKSEYEALNSELAALPAAPTASAAR
jgi:photosystem II stability/assembly factor-like uncharacterized protein